MTDVGETGGVAHAHQSSENPHYAQRKNLFEKAETEYRLEDDALVWTGQYGEQRMPFSSIRHVRCSHAPTRMKLGRYLVTVTAKNGQSLTIDNMHFKGVGDFEERTKQFVPFARALLGRLAAVQPDLTGRQGASPLAYWGNTLFAYGTMVILALVLLTLPIGLGDLATSSLIKLGIVAFFSYFLVRWSIRAWPRRFKVAEPPADLFPTI